MIDPRPLPRLRSLWIVAILFCAGCATTPVAPPTPTEQAAQLLRQAEGPHLTAASEIGLYLDAARVSLGVVTDGRASAADRAQAETIYNIAVAESVGALKKDNDLPSGTKTATFPGAGTTYVLHVVSQGGPSTEDPAKYQRLLDASKIYRKHLKSNIVRAGLGGALVGVITVPPNALNRAPGGYALPVTAVAEFGAASRSGETVVSLSFFNPTTKDDITVNRTTLPLKGDFTAPLAYFPRVNPIIFGLMAMLHSDRVATKEGIYFLEPFDREKIPILFIHGLMSSPHAWIDFVNDLDRSEDFRRHYQPWVLFYPSGGPIAANALRLRMNLSTVARDYPLKRNLVIVGHSMGGLLAQMQVTNSGRVLWDTVFGAKANELYASLPPDSVLKRALIFTANPHVSRVIFFSTPHLGSGLAELRIASIVGSLVRMPANLIHDFTPQMRSVLMGINPGLRTIPSSILGLSPKSPLLKGLAKLPIQVPYNSIVGNRGKDNIPLGQSSDGVVPYWSSHLDGAQSEIVVPTGHDSFDNPRSVTEVLRILKLQQ